MEKEIKDPIEAEAFVNGLKAEQKFVISVFKNVRTDIFVVRWQEHKTYTAVDGRAFPDEVWTTKEGNLVLVQDLEIEHCRNALRMILRRGREMADMVESFSSALEESGASAECAEDTRILH